MKWKNKGHEFDAVYERMKQKKAFYLFGAGEYGEAVYQEMHSEIIIKGFIDNDLEKQREGYLGKKVVALSEADKNAGIIVTVSPYTRKPMIAQLMTAGYLYNQDFFTMETFLSVYYAYELGKLYIPSISFLPSTKCNLNCAACLNFTPYMKHPMIRSWEQVKADVDIFFSCVDRIMLFHISGGEPFLYPDLARLIEYVDINYRNKIHFLRTVTNGTIIPSEKILSILKDHQIDVTLDDYRDAVPAAKENYSTVKKLLEEYGIAYESNKVDEWIDLAPLTTDHSNWDEFRLQKQFEGCHVPWQELRDRKIYSCNYASYAAVAGLTEEHSDEVFELNKFDKSKIRELMEFRMGYNEKGYVEFCKHCSGYVDINENAVEPARQKER